MASILAMIGGGLFNALAFSGSNYLFSKMSNHGEYERKRHDLATEKHQAAKDEWNQKRSERLDFINKKLREQQKATKDIKNLEVGMQEYYKFYGKRLEPLEREPKLTDHYNPSTKQKNGEIAFIVGGTALSSYLIFKYIK